jgi:hypothetical protein
MIGITLAARWSARSTISATAFWRASSIIGLPSVTPRALAACQDFRSAVADKRAFLAGPWTGAWRQLGIRWLCRRFSAKSDAICLSEGSYFEVTRMWRRRALVASLAGYD